MYAVYLTVTVFGLGSDRRTVNVRGRVPAFTSTTGGPAWTEMPGRGEVPISNCSFERAIHVRVNPAFALENFLGNHWQWILGTPLVSAGLGWIGHWVWKRRQWRSAGGRKSMTPR